MNSVFLLAGMLLAAAWLFRVLDAFFGMRRVPDISTPVWNREPHAPDGHAPQVTVIVPARNEERYVEAALRSMLELAYPSYEIIAVNDRSSDFTGAIMRRLARESPQRLRVLQIDELPPGWLGKTHAMWTAAAQATGEWLLFTDADVVFRADSLKRAMAYATETCADHVVLSPELEMRTAGERMMLAVFQILFAFWHRPWRVQDARGHEHIGVGAFNLIRREVYRSIGTYRVLRLAIIDDVKLGQLVKQNGFRQRFVFGRGLISLRWISGALAMVDNLTKNFFAVLDYRVWKVLAFTCVLLLFHLGPFAGALLVPGWTKTGYVVALVAIACLYVGLSWHSQVTPIYFFLHPIGALLFAYIALCSMVVALWHGGVIWRGTRYSLHELREAANRE